MKSNPILVSRHYLTQAKYRFDWDKEKAKEMAIEANAIGEELPDSLKSFYIYKTMPQAENTKLMIYDDKCFVFGLDEPSYPKAITIIPIKGH